MVRFPFAKRAWTLPVLVALYRTRQDNERIGKRHKAAAEQMGVPLRLALRWFPEHRFVFVGDGGECAEGLFEGRSIGYDGVIRQASRMNDPDESKQERSR